jgi:hypothetical protein
MSSEDIQGDEWDAYVTLERAAETNVGSPKGCEPYGDTVPVVVAGVATCLGGREGRPQGEGAQVIGHHKTRRYAKCKTPKRCWVSSDHWRATCIERCPRGSEGSRAEKDLLSAGTSPRGLPGGSFILSSMPVYPGAPKRPFPTSDLLRLGSIRRAGSWPIFSVRIRYRSHSGLLPLGPHRKSWHREEVAASCAPDPATTVFR